jgi:hypothetical protein
MIERFRNQRDELNQTAADIRTLNAALSDQIDVRDSITTTVDKETTSIKLNTESREENIEAAWGQVEANNAWAEAFSTSAELIAQGIRTLNELGAEEEVIFDRRLKRQQAEADLALQQTEANNPRRSADWRRGSSRQVIQRPELSQLSLGHRRTLRGRSSIQ